jgi:exopolysaccharide biosynthesis protein
MKPFILLLLLAAIVTVFLVIRFNTQNSETHADPVPVTTPASSKPAHTITYDNREFAYEYFIVENYKSIRLIPNFETPVNAETIVKDNACIHAINAGFYGKNSKPIGLWKNDETALGNADANPLLNGFYSIQDNKPAIGYDVPVNPRLAFQSGPILLHDGSPVKLAIRNDEPARRMIAGTASGGASVFLTVYDLLSPLRGPYLNDLPAIVHLVTKQIEIPFTMAINLDGGSASAYYSDNTGVWEINPVGSLLCVSQ